tara:strand:+ start:10029 stop:10532 length:504 start_codon:yes stop_codon:yes gene_type:complete
MGRIIVGVLIGMSLTAVSSMTSQRTGEQDPFNGTWTLNVEKTKELSGGTSPVHEIITFNIADDDIQHYRVEIQSSDDAPLRKGFYDSKYNEDKFVPYNGTVYPADGGMEVMTVKADDRTHYRIARTEEGEARYVMMRRLSEDGKSYISAGLTIDGQPGLYRWMERKD